MGSTWGPEAKGVPKLGTGIGFKLGSILEPNWTRFWIKSGPEFDQKLGQNPSPILGTESVPKMGDEKCTKNGGRLPECERARIL